MTHVPRCGRETADFGSEGWDPRDPSCTRMRRHGRGGRLAVVLPWCRRPTPTPT